MQPLEPVRQVTGTSHLGVGFSAGHVLENLSGGQGLGGEYALELGGRQNRELQPWAGGWEERRRSLNKVQ